MSMLLKHQGKAPRIGEGTFIAPNATVIGDTVLGKDCSVWYQTVIRGDVHPIRIGDRVNIQDLVMIHVTTGRHATTIHDEVTVGHAAVLHGCTLEARCLIGIRAVVLDGAVVGEESIVGAGSVVTPGMVIPPRVLVVGTPARVVRDLRAPEIADLAASAERYVALSRLHRDDLTSTEE
jgi:carbonic anhydrase/acetyltransferase-like protein (isoleucine patch superfamily)